MSFRCLNFVQKNNMKVEFSSHQRHRIVFNQLRDCEHRGQQVGTPASLSGDSHLESELRGWLS